MNKSKKLLVSILVAVLTVLLIAVVVLLVISIKKQKENENTLANQVQSLTSQKKQLESELAKANNEIQTKQNTALNLVEKLAKQELEGFSIQVGDQTYKAKDVDIVEIQLFTIDYLDLRAKKNELDGKPDDLSILHNEMKNGTYDYAGEIRFVLKYDEDVTGGFWAGTGPTIANGNYALGGALFTIKDEKIEFATGW